MAFYKREKNCVRRQNRGNAPRGSAHIYDE